MFEDIFSIYFVHVAILVLSILALLICCRDPLLY